MNWLQSLSIRRNTLKLLRPTCYEEGDKWFEKAIKRGAKPKDQESEIKRILTKKKGKERQQIIDHLLAKDRYRFAWVKRYTPK